MIYEEYLYLSHISNEARLRGIKTGPVNLDNYADGVAYIHLANVEKTLKLGVCLMYLRRNTLMALRLQHQVFMLLEQLK